MQDLTRRLLIVIIMGFCIACMFFSVNTVKAETNEKSHILHETKDWVWPVIGEISDHFGSRHGEHNGLDIAAPAGTLAVTVDDGVVTKSYYSFSYGHVIFIKHTNGFETVYAHLSKRLVKEGQFVQKGDIIGKVGNTGRSRGAHLHFEAHRGDWNYSKSHAINPLTVLDEEVLIETRANLAIAEKREKFQLAILERIQRKEQHTGWNIENYSRGLILSSSLVVASDDSEIGKDESPIQPVENMEQVTLVQVSEGMTLWDISQKYTISVFSLMEWNHLSSEIIVPGQMLYIYPEREVAYVVNPGDMLMDISQKYGVSKTYIMELNRLTNELLHPGQILTIQKS